MSFYVLLLLEMLCFITQRRVTNFRLNSARNYQGFDLGQLFSMVCLSARKLQAGWQPGSKLWSVNRNREKLFNFFNTDAELYHCKIWMPSGLALDGVRASLYILKYAFDINWCELCSHILLFLTSVPELERWHRIFWEFFWCLALHNKWGWGYGVSLLMKELQ